MAELGCEVEALGINYAIPIQKKRKMKKSDDDDDVDVDQRNVGAEGGGVRHVLKDVHFRAKPWEILAIVGPSGAGKSSLLEIVAGKLTPQTASIFVNQKPIDKARFKKASGYVTQKDTLFPLLTVEETLIFSANLRLNLPGNEIESRVKSLIQELGLSHVACTRVGDDRTRGISGGERRRVSIGVEIVHDPRVLILDEPTSGLDSVSALQIIDMLKIMAETRCKTIILSIHQPGFRIVKQFNSTLLLANGSVLHHGTVDQLSITLTQMGLTLPLHINVVDFAIDSIEAFHQHPSLQNQESKTGKFTLQQLFQQSKVVENEKGIEYPTGFANSRLRETIILTHRFSKNIFRTKELFACRTIQMLVSGLVLGSIFYNLKQDLSGAGEKVGLFAFTLTFLLSSTTEALPVFLQEREILMKETSCGSYRISSYAIANGLVYLPFLLILAILFSLPLYWLVGLNRDPVAFTQFVILIWLILYTANSVVVCISALVPNFIVGNSLVSGVMGSFFLFSGYFISKHGMPSYWVFMNYLSLFKYPFEGFLINEFLGSSENNCLEKMFGECVLSGEELLREEGYGEENGRSGLWRNAFIMFCFILVYRFIAYVILRFRCSNKCIIRGFLIIL
ncbi:ABC transporter G family member 5-like [Impatiens glandulifera]|uniref:ABC transporter G family member 5-like n=1 Tax=Impatiens glandulifera TaxID=253017 RepID=UPI001FB054E3|nr:ABC transporter G family member 5-like [Impatiens glandulifera]